MSSDPVIAALPRPIRAFRAFWSINPLLVFGLAFFFGVIPLFYAVLISPIGDAAYYMPVEAVECTDAAIEQGKCIEKHVGFQHALNWWPALLILFPLALYFVFDSVQNVKAVFARMRDDRMFTDRNWSAGEDENKKHQLHKMVRRLWIIFMVAGSVIFLIIGAGISWDWYCVVHTPLVENLPLASLPEDLAASSCAKKDAHENDWSIAATFGGKGAALPIAGYNVPGWTANYLFSAYVYLLLFFEMGLLMAYYGFIFAMAVTVYDLRRGKFELYIVPNLKSQDRNKRMGFEDFEPVFRPCVYATILAFSMAFLMRIQNLYLRDENFSIIYDFLLHDVVAVLSSMFSIDFSTFLESLHDIVDKLQKVFDFGQFKDPQSLLGPPLILVVLSMVSVALGVILRDIARESRSRVRSAINDPEQEARVETYYGLAKSEIARRTDDLQTWPLSWPRLRQSMILLFMGLFCFVFYRLALLWLGLIALRAIQGKLSEGSGRPNAPAT